ncbi:MAG: WHG domain-containing protein [Pseudonocardiales bacterium]|nr:WHG domain-containing protein [Pseudonocardiales bacterium]
MERRIAATSAFRNWALANTSAFLLLYGTPVPGFEPGPASDSGRAALRLAAPFVEVVYDGWTARELASIPLPPGGEALASCPTPTSRCPWARSPTSSSSAHACTDW